MSPHQKPVSIDSWLPPPLLVRPQSPHGVTRVIARALEAFPGPEGGFRDRLMATLNPEGLSERLQKQVRRLMTEREGYWASAKGKDSHVTSAEKEREAIETLTPVIIELARGMGKNIRSIEGIEIEKSSPITTNRLVHVRANLNQNDGALVHAIEETYRDIDRAASPLMAMIRDPRRGVTALIEDLHAGRFKDSHLNEVLRTMLMLKNKYMTLNYASPLCSDVQGLSNQDLINIRRQIDETLGGGAVVSEALARSMHLYNSLVTFFEALEDTSVGLEELKRQFIALFKNHLNLMFNGIAGQALAYLPMLDHDPEGIGTEAERIRIIFEVVNQCLMAIHINRKQGHLLGVA